MTLCNVQRSSVSTDRPRANREFAVRLDRFRRVSSAAALLVLLGGSLAAQESLAPRIISLKDSAEMVLVPRGSFIAGTNQSELKAMLKRMKQPMMPVFETESRKETRTLGDIYIDRYEVTNEQYERFMKATGHAAPRYWNWPQFSDRRRPVVGIGWADAEAYCAWAGKRLPTEDEWEKAARGSDGRIWPWGNLPDENRFNGKPQANYGPVAVGSFPAGDSPYGASDMAGNVWEMTYGTPARPSKAMRGGSFLNTTPEVRTTVRWAPKDPDRGANWLGFRCVMDAKNVKEYARPQSSP